MADFSNQDFGNIGLSFANWRRMAGMDKAPFPQAPASSAPPPTIAQEWEGAKNQLAAIPGAFKSAMSGNFSGAEKAMQSNPVPAVTPNPSTYDYDPGIETSMMDGMDIPAFG